MVIALLLIAVMGAGCCLRQSRRSNVNKGMHIIRAAILETVQLVEASYDAQLLDAEQYASAKKKVLSVTRRYNILLRATQGSVTPEAIEELLQDLARVRDRIQERWDD